MKKYVIGIDYGSLSARAILIDLSTGIELADSEFVYPHAILPSDYFPGIQMDKTTALQHPQDYLDALHYTMRDVITKAAIPAVDICSLGIDFTAATVLPVTADGTPLCFLEKFKNSPEAYAKLWNHHGAQAEAEQINALALKRKEPWLAGYGGKVSAEWTIPKLYEILNKAPEVFHATERYLEAGDWLVWMLTGTECHSSCMAGYKCLWNKETGYPSNDFWAEVNPALGNIIGTKISTTVIPTGEKAGTVNRAGSELSGLAEGTVVAAPIIDAHAALPGAGIIGPGKLMMSIGTSGCYIVMNEAFHQVKGIMGAVTDGIIPGYVAYESAQASVGNCFDWFIKNCVPESYTTEAKSRGISIYTLLNERAGAMLPGDNGIIALDWWNGNRCPYANFDLSGVILGLSLKTKPEDIYRGLIECTAYGAKAILDCFQSQGVIINELYAAGGISKKNPFLMQIYSDVFGMPIHVSDSTQVGAKGSALLASVAGGYFDTLEAAAAVVPDGCSTVYYPSKENSQKYQKLYQEYRTLCKYFAEGANDVMKRLTAN